MRRSLFIILLGFGSVIYAQDTLEFTDLYGDYLGQTPPGDTPVVFARGIVSTDDLEHSGPSFTPDGNEVNWIVVRPTGPNSNEWLSFFMTMRRKNGRWSTPYVSPVDFDLTVLSYDGRKAYSARGEDVWVIEKEADNWGEPKCLNILSRFPELQFLFWPTVTRTGTLYIHGYAPDVSQNYGIYRTEFVNDKYTKPELLPRSINLPPFQNWTLFIAPDDSYLIFSSDRTGQLGTGDLYISFHDVSADTWTEPINMGAPINTSSQERLPMVSRDGKYLFFTRWTPDHNQDVFWVSARIIDELREKSNMKK